MNERSFSNRSAPNWQAPAKRGVLLLVRGLDRLSARRKDDRVRPLWVDLWLQLGAQISDQLVECPLALCAP
jgi:hypothetical protein